MRKSWIFAEALLVFLPALLVIVFAESLAGDNMMLRQAIVWVANIVMLLTVYAGLRFRGQNWSHFGLGFSKFPWKSSGKVIGLSILVFFGAILGFVVGAIVMANIVGIPDGADLDSYNYLKGHPGLLILSLVGVYVVSSFGEEAIYRGFVMNRWVEVAGDSKFAWRVSIIVSALIFGLIHYDWGISGVVQTTCMGLVLGWAYVRLGRRLWINVLAHAYMDTILLVQLYLA